MTLHDKEFGPEANDKAARLRTEAKILAGNDGYLTVPTQYLRAALVSKKAWEEFYSGLDFIRQHTPKRSLAADPRQFELTPIDRASMFIEWCALCGFGLNGWPDGAHAQIVAHIEQYSAALQSAAPSMDVVREWEEIRRAEGSDYEDLVPVGDRMPAALTAQANELEMVRELFDTASETAKEYFTKWRESAAVSLGRREMLERSEATITELRAEAVAKFESWEKAENEYHDKISALTAEVERLTADIRTGMAAQVWTDLATARAERDTARTALEYIVARGEVFDAKGTHSKAVCDVARAALRDLAALPSPTLPTIKGEGK